MLQFLSQIDATTLTVIILYFTLSIVTSILSIKYEKIKEALKNCKELVNFAEKAWEDRKISPDEAKILISKLSAVLNSIKK